MGNLPLFICGTPELQKGSVSIHLRCTLKDEIALSYNLQNNSINKKLVSILKNTPLSKLVNCLDRKNPFFLPALLPYISQSKYYNTLLINVIRLV